MRYAGPGTLYCWAGRTEDVSAKNNSRTRDRYFIAQQPLPACRCGTTVRRLFSYVTMLYKRVVYINREEPGGIFDTVVAHGRSGGADPIRLWSASVTSSRPRLQ